VDIRLMAARPRSQRESVYSGAIHESFPLSFGTEPQKLQEFIDRVPTRRDTMSGAITELRDNDGFC
jgi:hypothetical protein